MDELVQGKGDVTQYALYHTFHQNLGNLAAEILAHVYDICSNQSRPYIWHKESFNLEVVDLGDGRARLQGQTCVGDCVDDEWFIVWLLRDITQRWNGTVASVEDSDGQFLLIEAANVLPRWISPTNADNRVWISGGRLHLIPLQYRSEPPLGLSEDLDADGYLDRNEALRLVTDPSSQTFSSQQVQEAVWKRISGYPDSITSTHLHRTFAFLPTEIQLALLNRPQLIASAVAAFYERDPIQLKACQTMSRFPPDSTSSTKYLVQMTRPLYSQIVVQKFYPPKPFELGRWFDGVNEAGDEWRWRDIGMKLTCGFEMLYQETKSQLLTIDLSQRDSTSIENNSNYRRFIHTLTNSGYFQGEIEGSKLYSKLLRAARDQWLENKSSTSCFAKEVEDAIASSRINPIPPSDQVEDSDTWLDMGPDDLEELFRGGERDDMTGVNEDERLAYAYAEKFGGLADKFQQFVEGEGALEGAMFEDEEFSDENSDEHEGMISEMTATERQERQDKLVDPLPADEWGRKEVVKPEANPEASSSAARPSVFDKEKYDGASDYSSDEDNPVDARAVGEDDVDLSSEMEDFLKFTRDLLGLSKDQYNNILQSRRDRGAFVPPPRGKAKPKTLEELAAAEAQDAKANHAPSVPKPVLKQQTHNANLNSFEALMEAMETELKRARPHRPIPQPPPTGQPTDQVDEDEELDLNMDAELASILKRDADDVAMEEVPDYGLMKNLLESYKSQAGLAGPVSNLAGRLDPSFRLPTDSDRRRD